MQISRSTARSRKSFSRPTGGEAYRFLRWINGRCSTILGSHRSRQKINISSSSSSSRSFSINSTVARGTFVISRACVSLLFLELEMPLRRLQWCLFMNSSRIDQSSLKIAGWPNYFIEAALRLSDENTPAIGDRKAEGGSPLTFALRAENIGMSKKRDLLR